MINAWFGPQRLVLVTIVSERSTCLCESRSKRSERTTRVCPAIEDWPNYRYRATIEVGGRGPIDSRAPPENSSHRGWSSACFILINIPRSFVGRLLQVFCSGRGSVVVVAVACRGPERVYVLAACGVFILDCLSELWGGARGNRMDR